MPVSNPVCALLTLLAGLVGSGAVAAAPPLQEALRPEAGSAGTAASACYWVRVEVPVGAVVDLAAGRVVSAPPEGDTPFLRGPLEAFQGNVELVRLDRERPTGPRRSVTEALAAAGQGAPYLKGLAEGDELVWRRGEAWGYVRLLEHAPQRAVLELARPGDPSRGLTREPSHLAVEVTPTGATLRIGVPPAADDPPGAADAGPWRIARRVVGAGGDFEEVAVTAGVTFEDADAPRDRLVEWRVARADAADPFGATARGLRVAHPGEWPLPLQVGMRIDLVSGALDTERAHVEVTQVTPPTVVLKPLGATILAPLTRPGAWALPERTSFDPSFAGKLRAFALGTELAALTDDGVIVRVELLRQDDGSAAIRRFAALDGERLAPRPPELVAVDARADGLALRAAPLPAEAERPDLVALVVERELALGREDWVVCDEGPPGARDVVVPRELLQGDPAGSETLVRVRVRQRYLLGPTSFAAPPRAALLLDPADTTARDAMLERAIAALDAPDWGAREGARRTLEALGDGAWPRLERLLLEGSAEARAAARQLLATGGSAGREVLFRSEAAALGVVSPMPPGLFAREPARRAHALILSLGAAEEAREPDAVASALGWAKLVAKFDDDAGVRAYADLLVGLADAGATGAARVPGPLAALTPPELRGSATADLTRLTGAELPLDARTLLRALERHPWLADREVGPVLGTLTAALASGAAPPRAGLPDYDRDSVDLALRLVARYTRGRDSRLLDAARAVLAPSGGTDWHIALEGFRLACAARVADERAPQHERPRVVLASGGGDEGGATPTLDDLEAALLELRQSGQRYVDLVLPAGDYVASDGATGRWIDLDIPGLRLVGEHRVEVGGGVVRARLAVGLRVMGARDVVLDGVVVEHAYGAAVMALDGAHLVVRGGAMLGLGTGIQAQDADIELFDTHVGDLAADRPGQFSLRHYGRGRVVARGTLFTGGSVYVGDLGEPYLERCVVDAGERPVLQAQRDGRPIVRESLMRATGMGLVNVAGGGCLAGVVLDVPRDPFGPRPDGLAVDPRWFVLLGAGVEVPRALVLARSPLERPR